MEKRFYKEMSKKNIEKYIYLSKLDFNTFILPKIVNIDNKWIYFELIDYDFKLLDLLKKWKDCSDIIFNVWIALWELHMKLKWNKFGFHNDFWSGNILLKWNDIYIIDFEEYNWFDWLWINNNKLLSEPIWDISMFLFHIKYDISVYNFFNLFRKKILYSTDFLNWYFKETWINYSINNINQNILIHIENMVNIKRKRNIKEFLKVLIWKTLYKLFNH